MQLTQEELKSALVEAGTVAPDVFEEIAQTKDAQSIGIAQALVNHGVLTDKELGQLLGIYMDVPFIELERVHIPKEILTILPEQFARHHKVIPVKITEKGVVIATSDPKNAGMRALLEKYIRERVIFSLATERDINAHLYLYQEDPEKVFEQILNSSQEEKVDNRMIQLVDQMITHAYHSGASDIHIEPEEEYTLIRYREDGILHDIAKIPSENHEQIMTRLKVMARLATDEHRKAQDGKIVFKTTWGEDVEIRISIVPTTQSEKVVMRLLSDTSHALSLSDLGLAAEDFKRVSNVIKKPWGMILVTGPTGSGKTTSLYAMLRILNKREVNVTTIEDPVEFDIEGVSQIQVNEKTGLTFAKGLRSIVRQDPDIVMVGEIRDTETASIAVNAAMTGHLVLSTLHTNDAPTAFLRLADMEVEDFLLASTVNVIIAQRLVRKICMSCISSTSFSEAEMTLLERLPNVKQYLQEISGKEGIEQLRTYKGKGCNVCHQSGYTGRIGIFEVLEVSEKVREAIMQKQNADQIKELATQEGMTSMLYDGLRKVVKGETTLEEVLRVTRE